MTAPRQQGFILVLALWVIAAVAFGAAMLGQWASHALEQAAAIKALAEGERAMLSARADLIYELTTNFLSVRGLELPDEDSAKELRKQINSPFTATDVRGQRTLRLDGRGYVYDDSLIMTVQDARGLLNLNLAPEGDISRLLQHFGVPPEHHQSLINRFLDYKEPGDLVRLGGAKRPQYVEAGRPPPSGQPLLTPWQARAILGWDLYPSLWRDPGIANLTSSGLVVGLNINTAPTELLGAIFDIPQEQMARLGDARQTVSLQSGSDLLAYGARAISPDPMRFLSFPADTFIVTFLNRKVPRKTVMAIALTPSDMTQPYRIDYTLELAFGTRDGDRIRNTTTRFPAPVAGAAAR
ncbi:MAG: general secretion pathway protein GspK [Proteobacteria bacterium]|nr:general secretion pathway protein GspK [Pseudomonadota bacterium]